MGGDNQRKTRIRADHCFHATWRRKEIAPPLESFFPVDAYDISQDGIALITEAFRPGECIVLLLGPPLESPALVVGEVVHVTAMRFGAVFHPVTGVGFTERLSEQILEQYQLHEFVNRQGSTDSNIADLWREPDTEPTRSTGKAPWGNFLP